MKRLLFELGIFSFKYCEVFSLKMKKETFQKRCKPPKICVAKQGNNEKKYWLKNKEKRERKQKNGEKPNNNNNFIFTFNLLYRKIHTF